MPVADDASATMIASVECNTMPLSLLLPSVILYLIIRLTIFELRRGHGYRLNDAEGMGVGIRIQEIQFHILIQIQDRSLPNDPRSIDPRSYRLYVR